MTYIQLNKLQKQDINVQTDTLHCFFIHTNHTCSKNGKELHPQSFNSQFCWISNAYNAVTGMVM